ncbi:hypothetical protein NONO_c70540 [Nocardia nova SH22a]|uniref:Uncharacterized protein n=1 Tax=Nocardia nova SH22a TaxID=1415166 RepID=W5TR09_9NOCA|nr:hypothetical protein [Nocardia nova]AHH21815.1 hypothetical protein NONO_c70540 [Nocardia nova SH22a]
MSEPVVSEGDPGPAASESSVFRRLGVDWWAVIVAGVFVVLALGDVLPKIPW